MGKRLITAIVVLAATLVCMPFIGTPASAAEEPFTFGMLLVGPYNDHGWSQAHFEGGKYVEEKIPGVEMIYIDKVNPADRPGITIPQLVDDMVAKASSWLSPTPTT